MPTIAMFYGIIIRMYCSPNEHNPPHFHAYYQDDKAIININDCELKEGKLPSKQMKLYISVGGNTQRRVTGRLGIGFEGWTSI